MHHTADEVVEGGVFGAVAGGGKLAVQVASGTAGDDGPAAAVAVARCSSVACTGSLLVCVEPIEPPWLPSQRDLNHMYTNTCMDTVRYRCTHAFACTMKTP